MAKHNPEALIPRSNPASAFLPTTAWRLRFLGKNTIGTGFFSRPVPTLDVPEDAALPCPARGPAAPMKLWAEAQPQRLPCSLPSPSCIFPAVQSAAMGAQLEADPGTKGLAAQVLPLHSPTPNHLILERLQSLDGQTHAWPFPWAQVLTHRSLACGSGPGPAAVFPVEHAVPRHSSPQAWRNACLW